MSVAENDIPKLTPRQKRFCEEYVKDYNRVQAYLRAYDTNNYDTATTGAMKIIRKKEVLEYIRLLEKEIYEEKGINAEHIAIELSKIAFEGEADTVANKLKAIDLLQKQLNLQSQRIDANLQTDISIKIE